MQLRWCHCTAPTHSVHRWTARCRRRRCAGTWWCSGSRTTPGSASLASAPAAAATCNSRFGSQDDIEFCAIFIKNNIKTHGGCRVGWCLVFIFQHGSTAARRHAQMRLTTLMTLASLAVPASLYPTSVGIREASFPEAQVYGTYSLGRRAIYLGCLKAIQKHLVAVMSAPHIIAATDHVSGG